MVSHWASIAATAWARAEASRRAVFEEACGPTCCACGAKPWAVVMTAVWMPESSILTLSVGYPTVHVTSTRTVRAHTVAVIVRRQPAPGGPQQGDDGDQQQGEGQEREPHPRRDGRGGVLDRFVEEPDPAGRVDDRGEQALPDGQQQAGDLQADDVGDVGGQGGHDVAAGAAAVVIPPPPVVRAVHRADRHPRGGERVGRRGHRRFEPEGTDRRGRQRRVPFAVRPDRRHHHRADAEADEASGADEAAASAADPPPSTTPRASSRLVSSRRVMPHRPGPPRPRLARPGRPARRAPGSGRGRPGSRAKPAVGWCPRR